LIYDDLRSFLALMDAALFQGTKLPRFKGKEHDIHQYLTKPLPVPLPYDELCRTPHGKMATPNGWER